MVSSSCSSSYMTFSSDRLRQFVERAPPAFGLGGRREEMGDRRGHCCFFFLLPSFSFLLAKRCCQLRDGLIFEELHRLDRDTGFVQPRHDVQTRERRSTEIEEVVVDADPIQAQ